jgi:hypothetical protein
VALDLEADKKAIINAWIWLFAFAGKNIIELLWLSAEWN